MDTDHDKIIRTEEKLDALGKIVYEIKDNHLVHLKDQLDVIETKLDSINVKIATYVGGAGVLMWLANKFIG